MTQSVLIVDDDPDCRELLGHVLAFEGFAVLSAGNGIEALHAARQHHPRLILLDLMMPVMDGYQFRRHQAMDADIATIPVLCISGTYDAERAARQMGAIGCVAKPIAIDELVRVVKATLHTNT